MVKSRRRKDIEAKAELAAEERVLDALVGSSSSPATREAFRRKLHAGELNDKEIEVELPQSGSGMPMFELPNMPGASIGAINIADIFGKGSRTKAKRVTVAEAHEPLIAAEADKLLDQDAIVRDALAEVEIELRALPNGVDIMAPPGMEEMQQQLQSMFQNLGGNRTRTRKLKVSEALRLLIDEEAGKLINEDELKILALANAEQNGIVFIDEIDKVTRRGETVGADVSREGVQRDLLPLVEGSTVNTKYGPLKTDHVLFIASGAFSLSKPSDLIPELQGRLPIRVELDSLKVGDFVRILTEPDASLTAQYKALMRTEGLDVTFAEDGVRRIAEIAAHVNERTENIGARRLHTVVERLLETVSYDAAEQAERANGSGARVTIDAKYVDDHLGALVKDEDLSRYIL